MTKKKKILIIEDEKALTDVLKTKLEKDGYSVLAAEDGKRGCEALGQYSPDLILLDIAMPQMDGYEVLQKLKNEGVKIPVIVISNSGQPVEIEKTKKLGAVDHLVKTEFDPLEVVSKVRMHLGDRAESPKEDGKSSIKAIRPSEADAGVKPDTGIRVLLVEDDAFLRSICSKKLVKEGFTVYEAVDGEMALGEVAQIKPDVILLDIILPAIDGFEVLTSIRSHADSLIKKTPIIMLSNLGQDDDIKKALEMGANDYLVKAHFTIEEIITKVRKVLGK
jgi:DNA-binding response OmpR family regulator